MVIRRASSSDLQALVELFGSVQELHYENRPDWFNPADPVASTEVIQDWFGNATMTVLLAEDEAGTCVGFSAVSVEERPATALTSPMSVLHIGAIAVAAGARRQGVGHKLFEAMRDLAGELGTTHLELIVWYFNLGARRFFESEGMSVANLRLTAAVR